MPACFLDNTPRGSLFCTAAVPSSPALCRSCICFLPRVRLLSFFLYSLLFSYFGVVLYSCGTLRRFTMCSRCVALCDTARWPADLFFLCCDDRVIHRLTRQHVLLVDGALLSPNQSSVYLSLPTDVGFRRWTSSLDARVSVPLAVFIARSFLYRYPHSVFRPFFVCTCVWSVPRCWS